MHRPLALLASLAAKTAAAIPSPQLPLTQTSADCAGYNTPSSDTSFGFVNLVKTGSNKVVANVVLQNAVVGTYGYRLIQLPNEEGSCGYNPADNTIVYDGQFATDSSGNGHVNIQETVLHGATEAWVDLNKVDAIDIYYNTPLAPL